LQLDAAPLREAEPVSALRRRTDDARSYLAQTRAELKAAIAMSRVWRRVINYHALIQ
jgi:hypothetical protein